MARAPAQHYLVGIDAAVDSPRSLEVLQHALLEWTGQAVHSDEVFEVLHAAVVERASGVHALDDGGDIPKHYCVHQRCRGGNHSISGAITPPLAPCVPRITLPLDGSQRFWGGTGELADFCEHII